MCIRDRCEGCHGATFGRPDEFQGIGAEGFRRIVPRHPWRCQSASEILWEKLHWTFQADKTGDLVLKGATHGLAFKCWVDGEEFSYSWRAGAERKRWAKRWIRPRGNGRNALWVVMATGRALPPA